MATEEKRGFKFVLTGKRLQIAVFAAILFVLLGAPSDFLTLIKEIYQELERAQFQFNFPFGLGVNLPPGPTAISVLWKSAFSVGAAWAFIAVFLKGQDARFDELFNYYQKHEEQLRESFLLDMLNLKSGIAEIYDPEPKLPAAEQPYAIDVSDALSRSNRCWLLTIAGYEFIGKRQKSLLAVGLKKNTHVETKVILLDGQNGKAVVDKRANDLRRCDSNYSSKQLLKEIQETEDQLRQLFSLRSKQPNPSSVELYKSSFLPAFRILMFDAEAFVSTYEKDCHGHESPVYRIVKPKDANDGQVSLYGAFETMFQNALAQSQKANLG